jgi:hypothetical protein
MKKYKRKGAKLLLVVFSAILLCSFSFSNPPVVDDASKVTIVQAQQISSEAPGNVSRIYIEFSGFESRVFHDFTFLTIQEIHSQLNHTGFVQLNLKLAQFKAPVKVYKQIRKFLI